MPTVDAVLTTVWHKAPDRQFYKCLIGCTEVNCILRWVLMLISYLSLRVGYWQTRSLGVVGNGSKNPSIPSHSNMKLEGSAKPFSRTWLFDWTSHHRNWVVTSAQSLSSWNPLVLHTMFGSGSKPLHHTTQKRTQIFCTHIRGSGRLMSLGLEVTRISRILIPEESFWLPPLRGGLFTFTQWSILHPGSLSSDLFLIGGFQCIPCVFTISLRLLSTWLLCVTDLQYSLNRFLHCFCWCAHTTWWSVGHLGWRMDQRCNHARSSSDRTLQSLR